MQKKRKNQVKSSIDVRLSEQFSLKDYESRKVKGIDTMNRIKWVTQAIAQPSKIQKELFPDFANVADELAVEWELALDEVNTVSVSSLLKDEQKTCFKRLDNYMLSISGAMNIQYWNDEALCHSKEWDHMRKLAADILIIMGWENTAPPRSNAIYVNNS